MIKVNVQDHGTFERAMRHFKKACQRDGFMIELKERRYFTKPSEKKRLERKKTRR